MTPTSANPQQTVAYGPTLGYSLADSVDPSVLRETRLARLRLLWNRRRFLTRATATGLLATTLLAFLIPARYESTTRLMPPESQSASGLAMMAGLTGQLGGLGALAGEALGMKSTGAMFVGILRSATVQDRLVERFQLKKVYGNRLEVDARNTLAENTSILEDRKSGIITITITDGDPKRAAAIAGAYVEELDRLVAQLSTSAAHRERGFLEERLKAVKQDLDTAAEQFGQFASKNIAIDIKEQGRAMVGAAATLMGQLVAAQSEIKGLEQIYTENNVRVRSVHARIAELQHQLEKLGGKPLTAGGAGVDPAADALYPSIRKLPLLGVTYADLYRRTKIQEVVFETLTQQHELAKVQEAKETPSVKVLDAPQAPERKSSPPRLLMMFLGTFFSLAFAAVWVLVRARWEGADAHDPRKVFALEVFQSVNAQMPWAAPNGSRFQKMTHKVWSRLSRQSGTAERHE
jgi:uncharacterized protein involved in exopolysaccharide biosynthesis